MSDATAPMIGRISAREVIFSRTGFGIGSILAVVAAVAIAFAVVDRITQPPIAIDQALIVEQAIARGFIAPEEADALRDRLARAQEDLDALRAANPDWGAEVARITTAFNESNSASSRKDLTDAFARLRALISQQRQDLRVEEARMLHAEATLLYPFEASQAAPLLCDAAELADQDFWYWIECGRARGKLGDSERALTAAKTALAITQERQELGRDAGVAVFDMGEIFRKQGNLKEAERSFELFFANSRRLFDLQPSVPVHLEDAIRGLQAMAQVRRASGNLDGEARALEAAVALSRILVQVLPDDVLIKIALSRSLSDQAGAFLDRGDLQSARADLDEALGITEDAVEADPENVTLQETYSVQLVQLGFLRLAEGLPEEAKDSFEKARDIREDLVEIDGGNLAWRRGVAVAERGIGFAHWDMEDWIKAQEAFSKSRDELVSVLEQSPENIPWQRDLREVALWLGDTARMTGDLPMSVEAYEDAVGAARAVLAVEPTSASAQRDLVVALSAAGDAYNLSVNNPAATESYAESVTLLEAMLVDRPDVEMWRRDLALNMGRLASVDTDNAEAHWAKTIALLEALIEDGIAGEGFDNLLVMAKDALSELQNGEDTD